MEIEPVKTLQGLTDQPNQQYPIVLPDGSTATLYLRFCPQQIGWFYGLGWNGQTPPFECDGNKLVVTPNALRQLRNILPFGIAVVTPDGSDPAGQEDFVDGSCTLLLLDPTDVASIETTYFPGS